MKRSRRLKKSGLTLLEILISLVILALVMTGMVNVFIVGRRYIQHSRARLTAAAASRYFLSPLQGAVRADTFDSGILSVGQRSDSLAFGGDPIAYNSTYKIDNMTLPSGGLLRKVNLTVQWNEFDP